MKLFVITKEQTRDNKDIYFRAESLEQALEVASPKWVRQCSPQEVKNYKRTS
jgi:hypothetical protein